MRVEHSLYDVLDASPDATAEQIRHAYRIAARRTHPDAGGSSPAFERVTVAYQVLGDPDRRRRYDLRLAAGTAGPPTAPGSTRTRPGAPGPHAGTPGPQYPGTPGPGPGTPRTPPWAAGPTPSPGPSGVRRDRPGGTDPRQSVPRPGADPVVRRRYLILMTVALALFISAGTIVRLFSVPAAMIMMMVAALIPPIAVTVAGRPRRPPPDTDPRRPRP
jgi:hypothetical protein